MQFLIFIMKIKSRQIFTASHHYNVLQCIIYSHGRQKLKKNLHGKITGFGNAISLWSGDFLLLKLFPL